MTNYGCRVYDANTWGIKIEYCPMHQAAPELLEACKKAVEISRRGAVGIRGQLAREQELEVVLLRAIAKAGPVGEVGDADKKGE